MLFEHFEGYDIQKVRKESKEEGRDLLLIKQVHKKMEKGQVADDIADDLVADVKSVQEIIEAIDSLKERNEEYDDEKVLTIWKQLVASASL